MTSYGDRQDAVYVPYQNQGYTPKDDAPMVGGMYVKDQDYEILEAGFDPSPHTQGMAVGGGAGGGAAELEKQLRLGE